jgi:hypothetical protein
MFQQHGATLLDAKQKAIQLVEKVVVKQSSFSSYLDAFFYRVVFCRGITLADFCCQTR